MILNKKIIDSINFILNKMTSTDKANGITNISKYWKIGTNPFCVFQRLINNIKSLDISKPIIIIKNNNFVRNENQKKDRFWLMFGNINVTPAYNKKIALNGVAPNTIGQYIDMLEAFDFGVAQDRKKRKVSVETFCNYSGKITILPNFLLFDFNNNQYKYEITKKIIIKSLFNNNSSLKNIAYSIFIEILLKIKFDFKNLSDENAIVIFQHEYNNTKQYENMNSRYFNLKNNDELIKFKKNIKKQGSIATYKKIIECFINQANIQHESFDDIFVEFINEIICGYNERQNTYETNQIIENQICIANIDDIIARKRGSIKNEIFEHRRKMNLINSINDVYSDLVTINDNQIAITRKFKDADAAHIYSCSNIRIEAKNMQDKKMDWLTIKKMIIKNLINPLNGLIMPKDYHSTLDKGRWSFDINGKMVINEDEEDYLLNIMKLEKIKIRKEIFNNEIIDFIKKSKN